MAILKSALAFAAASAALLAQPAPVLRVEAVNAGSVLYVKNTATQPLTAYLIELVDYPGSSFTLFDDYPTKPIAPGAERRIPITNMTVGAAPEYVKITAAVYADGSTAGDPAKTAMILGRRKTIADTDRELAARLQKAKAAGTAKDAVIADLKQWSDSLQAESRSRRLTAASVNAAAARRSIAETVDRLETGSIEAALAHLLAKP